MDLEPITEWAEWWLTLLTSLIRELRGLHLQFLEESKRQLLGEFGLPGISECQTALVQTLLLVVLLGIQDLAGGKQVFYYYYY